MVNIVTDITLARDKAEKQIIQFFKLLAARAGARGEVLMTSEEKNSLQRILLVASDQSQESEYAAFGEALKKGAMTKEVKLYKPAGDRPLTLELVIDGQYPQNTILQMLSLLREQTADKIKGELEQFRQTVEDISGEKTADGQLERLRTQINNRSPGRY